MYGDKLLDTIGWEIADQDVKFFDADLTVLYDTAIDRALERAKHKSGRSDYFERKPTGYFERVQAGFTAAAKRYNATLIDATPAAQAVHQATMAAVRAVLAPRAT